MFQLKLHSVDDFGFSTERRKQNGNLPEKNHMHFIDISFIGSISIFLLQYVRSTNFVHRTFDHHILFNCLSDICK